jgi:TPR repeat protein
VAKCAGDAARYWGAAAVQGHWNAHRRLGILYMMGDGVEKDEGADARHFKIAADNGDVEAQRKFSFCLTKGLGVAADEVEAKRYLRMAFDHSDADRQFAHATSSAVESDEERVHCLQLAAQKEHAEAAHLFSEACGLAEAWQ